LSIEENLEILQIGKYREQSLPPRLIFEFSNFAIFNQPVFWEGQSPYTAQNTII